MVTVHRVTKSLTRMKQLSMRTEHKCMAESLCCSPEITTALLISYTPIQSEKLKVWIKFFLIQLSFCGGKKVTWKLSQSIWILILSNYVPLPLKFFPSIHLFSLLSSLPSLFPSFLSSFFFQLLPLSSLSHFLSQTIDPNSTGYPGYLHSYS